jgi:hypothetical protein
MPVVNINLAKAQSLSAFHTTSQQVPCCGLSPLPLLLLLLLLLLLPPHRCVYLPMYGFTESLNVGVASGLVSGTG